MASHWFNQNRIFMHCWKLRDKSSAFEHLQRDSGERATEA